MTLTLGFSEDDDYLSTARKDDDDDAAVIGVECDSSPNVWCWVKYSNAYVFDAVQAEEIHKGLLTMDSKELKMHVSESDKMEASVLGCRLSEKAEHLPIKKRRFLFMNSSLPLNTSSSEGTETVAACLQSSSQEAHPKPDANCPPAAPLTVADLHQSEIIDSKLDVQKFSKKMIEKEDIHGASIASGSENFQAKSVKVENLSSKETDMHISTAPFKDFASSTVNNSTPDESECIKTNQVTSSTQKSAALDDRLNWDLNTIMAWEEQLECDRHISSYKEGKFKQCEQGRICSSVSGNIGTEISHVKLRSLIPKIERSEMEECEPVFDGIREVLPPVISSMPLVVVNKIKSLHDQHASSSIPDVVPSALTLEHPLCKISAKPVNVTPDFTFMPLGLDHYIDKRASEENIVSSKIASVQTTENDKLNLSLVTAPSIKHGVHQDGSTFDEDDKANVKRVINSNGIGMDSLISRGDERSQNVLVSSKIIGSGNYVNHGMTSEQTTEDENLNLSLITATITETVVSQSGSMLDYEDDKSKVKRVITNKGITMENPPAAASISSMHVVCSDVEVPLQHGKSCINEEVCDHENVPSDIQAGSEVDNIGEVSLGNTDSLFEDGEFRESSIQTWEGNDREDREIEHGTENRNASGAHENDSLKSTDVGSQKGTDEISSVLLPEKPDSSDQISGSEPNLTENCTTEVNMKDGSQSDQWKMNVSGSNHLPETHSSSNGGKIKDLSSIKSSFRITEDLETKAELSRFYRREPSTRDTFLSRSRFRMQGSSINADDSASRFVRDSGVIRSTGRGKYTRGGGTWDRSPTFSGSSFRRSLPEDVDNLTCEGPGVTRGSLRSRLTVNSEEDEFRARLGLRPSGDTCHNRFVNTGRGRLSRYASRHNDTAPRERYYGLPTNDEPLMDYSHSFLTRRRCYSPPHHHSGSTSPPRSRARSRSPIGDGFRCRSRSPNLRSDTRVRREPNYRHRFESDHVGGYSLEQPRNNSPPPSSRFSKYKQRSLLFDKRSPPSGERLGFYESSRRTKQNENYRSSRYEGGRDVDVVDHGYRRGGFVRPYDMDRPVQYNEEEGYGVPPVYDKETMEFRGRGNVNGTDARFRDLPRRPREDRDKW
ncbi:hypothetical protein E3N88_30544 [Mikania micrantha]|uniref:Uncharacterized protein n=1 Tax=Mikania micrantha TaxID=192012 RepID=A0A5N6MM49_9ASTR|nr:hypothetical protein E3N88_30544 [Mikania micrantha]